MDAALMNFKETSAERLNLRLQRQTLDDREFGVELLKLYDGMAAHINLMIAACPLDQMSRIPPRFQSLRTEQMAWLDVQKEAYFAILPTAMHKEVCMKPTILRQLYGRDAGKEIDTTVYPVKARLYCEGRRIMLGLVGEIGVEYHWQIDIQGALYKGTYELPRN